MNILRCVGAEIRETKTRMSYIAASTESSDDIFGSKTLNLAVSSFSPCVFNLGVVLSIVANTRERVYFERQILTLLVVHPNPNLSHIKFSHISRQVNGLCIS